MKNLLAKIFGKSNNTNQEPRTIDSIVESFSTQMVELDERIAFDEASIVAKKEEAKKLAKEAESLETDVKRSNRIKSKIAEFIA